MVMAFQIQTWTLCGLIGAFIDLVIAYFLLCGSAFAFFASKFGIYLPCPCTGLLGYQNSYICWHKLLVDEPIRMISSVQMLIKSKFPFDFIWFKHQPRNSCNGVLELENNEASSSSFSTHNLAADREGGLDAKGKKIVNQKQKYGIRRRKRSTLGYRKFQSQLVSYGNDWIEDGLPDNQNAANALDLGETTWPNFEKNEVTDNGLSSIENFVCKSQDNDISDVRMLEEALEMEKAACAVLHSELEKERAAAATAADEAMAMILRLQEDKALIEMEARQYHCMIEENFAYQEEEMNILKEILVRRERENHFLEKEVEAYRQMKGLGNVQSDSEWGQKPLRSLDWNDDPPPLLQEIENIKSVSKNKAENNANLSSIYKASSSEVPQTRSDIKNNLSYCENEIKKDNEPGTEVSSNLHSCIPDSEPIVYDVHVIDDKTKLKEESGNGSGLSNCAATEFGILSGEVSSASRSETNQHNHRSSFEMENRVPVLSNSHSKNLPSDSARSSSPAANGERLKIDTEIEFLRERLRRVQEGKEKLIFPSEHRDNVNAQLKLVEEIVNQLREIQQLREPVRQASLPPKASKVSLKKRRCHSASLEIHESSS
ncbi:hypothetical protein Ddye_016640 [Dipteronia dyeriana]|uniref:GTD-binding domain-containing protein n=1 Tax=Dipteronia dyeriana TaxID=168575 RepID=A0AAD9U755_9ROSI|nr:hypothetical protein Ddye_016640 [Dipteronia dyeriana]